MKRLMKASGIVLLGLMTLAPVSAGAAPVRRFVGAAPARNFVVVRGYYGFGGFYGPGWWDPGWYGGWWGPPYGYYRAPYMGEVKIKTHMKDALVYVDGGYAGTAGKMKKFPLRPGRHTIELRDPNGHRFYSERVTVIAGKTLHINPDYRG